MNYADQPAVYFADLRRSARGLWRVLARFPNVMWRHETTIRYRDWDDEDDNIIIARGMTAGTSSRKADRMLRRARRAQFPLLHRHLKRRTP